MVVNKNNLKIPQLFMELLLYLNTPQICPLTGSKMNFLPMETGEVRPLTWCLFTFLRAANKITTVTTSSQPSKKGHIYSLNCIISILLFSVLLLPLFLTLYEINHEYPTLFTCQTESIFLRFLVCISWLFQKYQL